MAHFNTFLLIPLAVAIVLGGTEGQVLGKLKEIGWPKCLGDMELPSKMENTFFLCEAKNFQNMRTLSGSVFDEKPTFASIDDIKAVMDPIYGECVVQRLEYSRPNGSLDDEKVLKDVDSIKTNSTLKLFRFRAMATRCLKEAPGDDAAKDFAYFLNCLHSEADNFCEEQKKVVEVYLNSKVQPSRCKAVQSHPQMEQFLEMCKTDESKDVPKRRRRNTSGGESTIPEIARHSLCLGVRLGYYTRRTGFSFTDLNEAVMSLEGWSELPEDLQTNLNLALTECSSLVGGSTTSFTTWFEWEMCIKPKIINLCGFENNITNTILPLLDAEVAGVAWKYVISAVSIALDTNGPPLRGKSNGEVRGRRSLELDDSTSAGLSNESLGTGKRRRSLDDLNSSGTSNESSGQGRRRRSLDDSTSTGLSNESLGTGKRRRSLDDLNSSGTSNESSGQGRRRRSLDDSTSTGLSNESLGTGKRRRSLDDLNSSGTSNESSGRGRRRRSLDNSSSSELSNESLGSGKRRRSLDDLNSSGTSNKSSGQGRRRRSLDNSISSGLSNETPGSGSTGFL